MSAPAAVPLFGSSVRLVLRFLTGLTPSCRWRRTSRNRILGEREERGREGVAGGGGGGGGEEREREREREDVM